MGSGVLSGGAAEFADLVPYMRTLPGSVRLRTLLPALLPRAKKVCHPGTRFLPIFLCFTLSPWVRPLMGLMPLEATALLQPWVSAVQSWHQVLPCELFAPPSVVSCLPVKSQRLSCPYLGGDDTHRHLGAEILIPFLFP